jgi:hypothetical protein
MTSILSVIIEVRYTSVNITPNIRTQMVKF